MRVLQPCLLFIKCNHHLFSHSPSTAQLPEVGRHPQSCAPAFSNPALWHQRLSPGMPVQAPSDATPGWAGGETPAVGATPTPKRQRSRWDETPMGATPAPGATPAVGVGMPLGMTPGATPVGGLDMATPSPSMLPTGATPTAEQYQVRISLPACLPACQLVAGIECARAGPHGCAPQHAPHEHAPCMGLVSPGCSWQQDYLTNGTIIHLQAALHA